MQARIRYKSDPLGGGILQFSISLRSLNTRLYWQQKVIGDTEHDGIQTKLEGHSIKWCTCIPERITSLSS